MWGNVEKRDMCVRTDHPGHDTANILGKLEHVCHGLCHNQFVGHFLLSDHHSRVLASHCDASHSTCVDGLEGIFYVVVSSRGPRRWFFTDQLGTVDLPVKIQ